MSRRDNRTPEQQEMDEMRERVTAKQARLDETLTRREVIESIEWVMHEYSCNGDHDSDLIYGAFKKLAEALS
jgi:hypothetical protein